MMHVPSAAELRASIPEVYLDRLQKNAYHLVPKKYLRIYRQAVDIEEVQAQAEARRKYLEENGEEE